MAPSVGQKGYSLQFSTSYLSLEVHLLVKAKESSKIKIVGLINELLEGPDLE